MPRLSVSLTPAMHKHLSLLAAQHNLSISHMINHLLQVGVQYLDKKPLSGTNPVEPHCQQLIIQMNALVKNMAAEVLKFNQEDFEKLRHAALNKYHELAQEALPI